jgi:hypothetical protein
MAEMIPRMADRRGRSSRPSLPKMPGIMQIKPTIIRRRAKKPKLLFIVFHPKRMDSPMENASGGTICGWGMGADGTEVEGIAVLPVRPADGS